MTTLAALDTRRTRNGDRQGHTDEAVVPVRICLLGGFRIARGGVLLPGSVWGRRTAKALTKLLAAHPRHALHREEVLELLWSQVGAESALNSFGKALHAARRALEPELAPRATSSYLQLRDEMVVLDGESVVVDADEFELLARRALDETTVPAYEEAIAAYGGELLPEDRYADWAEGRRSSLSDLFVRLLLGRADALEQMGADGQAIDSLRAALRGDPTREDVHRRLMQLYAKLGTPEEALKQFHTCRQVLRRELRVVPGRETEALYRDLLGSVAPTSRASRSSLEAAESHPVQWVSGPVQTPFVGRKRILKLLHDQLTRAEQGRGLTILLTGETGIGKTRLVAEFLEEARRRGAASLEAAERPADSEDRVRHDPDFVHFAPSFASRLLPVGAAVSNGDGKPESLARIVELLTNLQGTRPVVVVLGDVGELASSLPLLETLGALAARRCWLVIGTADEQQVGDEDDVRRRLEALASEGLCVQFHLPPLEQAECDQLAHVLLPGGTVAPKLLKHVYTSSLGNPLLAEELLREMLERGVVSLEEHSWRATA
jgi:DNA-binding SARP family transcriptional activator